MNFLKLRGVRLINIKIMSNNIFLEFGGLTSLGVEPFDFNDLMALFVNAEGTHVMLVFKDKTPPIELTDEARRFYKIISPYLNARSDKLIG